MLIDLIPPQKLPWILVWLDWNLFAYWPSLIASLVVFIGHYWITMQQHSVAGISLAAFVGVCSWTVFCAIRYGYAVG